MENYKYTSDGKKVIIVGNLNSQEKIVQEIFVVNGQEVPSGENFVVKSLHDALAVSWKEKEIKKMEERYKIKKEEYNELENQYRTKAKVLKEKLLYISKACNNVSEESFELLADYIAGDIKYIVRIDYKIEIIPFEEFKEYYDERLRLISFFGRDDGTFTYAIGDYGDYSGGETKFVPCKSYDEAISVVQEKLDSEKKYSHSDIIIAEKYDLSLDQEKLRAYKQKAIDDNKEIIAKNEEVIANAKERNKSLSNL